MNKLIDSVSSFSRRVFVFAFIKFSLLFTLICRLFYLQIFSHDKYQTLANNNRIRLHIIPAQRGKIVDANGKPLAYNQSYYRASFYKESDKNYFSVINKLGQLLSLSNHEIENMIVKIKKGKPYSNIVIKENLSWEAVANIELHTPDLPSISVEVAQIRSYPYGSICAHITGYVSYIQKNQKTPFHHPEFRVGAQGVEKTKNDILQGHAGIKKLEVNAGGLVIREISRQNSVVGTDQKLTIDVELQSQLYEYIPDDYSVTSVLLDIPTGNVLSVISTPMYDPNQFVQTLSEGYWNSLRNNKNYPLVNKAVSGQYSPGSIFKLIVTLAALEDGISPDTTFYCDGSMHVGNHNFRCARRYGHQEINMYQATNMSCNVYMYNLAKKLGHKKIANMAYIMGLGNAYNIGFTGEASGLIPSKEWKKQHRKKDWLIGDTLNMSIGQGYLLNTPIQMAVMIARAASGKMVIPRLFLDNNPANTEFVPLPLTSRYLPFVHKSLNDVVNKPTGTAYRHRITESGMEMAGKTGTSQIISLKNRTSIDKKELDHHGIFVGYAPVHKPKFACAVVVEHGGGGSKSAAPIARKILLNAQKLYSS